MNICEPRQNKVSEQAEIQRLNAEQERSKECLQSLINIFQYDADDIQALLDFALNEAITLTGSKYGYLYYYNEETKQFILNSWSHDVMHSCSVADPQSLYHLDKTGMWGEAVRQRKPIVINDFAAPDPLKKGYPEGHVKLTSFLTIPLFDQRKIVAVVGVANKEEGYNDSDLTQLILLMEAVWKVAERRRVEKERQVVFVRQQGINLLLQSLIAYGDIDIKLKKITDSIVTLFDVDFCRIWLIRPGDLCEQGCTHANPVAETHMCRNRDCCLHLVASSGRYTHTNGKLHRRVPFGCYKIGLIASGEQHKFVCNDVQNDPRIHDRDWARDLGLESFAGYQLRVPDGEAIGVLAVFAKHRILSEEDAMLDGLGSAIALVMQQSVAEEARKQKEQQIEEKNRELERFIYTVSHDLKSPLVTISAFLGYLETDISASDASRIQQDLGFIRTAADKMGVMLAALLDLSRIGRVEVTPVEVAFGMIISEALQMVAGAISERGVSVSVAESSLLLYGDRARLLEIWQNLIENAVKYMGDQVEPHIDIAFEHISGETVFYVRDNGMGIAQSYHDNIFGLFNKLDVRSEGSGLGLALTKRIVEMYGGLIWVQSEGEGSGSCFRFTLPGALKH